MTAWWLPPTFSRYSPFQFHMAFGSACQACQHMGSFWAMVGSRWLAPHRSQHPYARCGGSVTEPWADAGWEVTIAATSIMATARSAVTNVRGRARTDMGVPLLEDVVVGPPGSAHRQTTRSLPGAGASVHPHDESAR